MNLFSALRKGTNIAGGAFYHYSAFRFSKKLWRPYVSQLNEWLMSWSPDSDKLLLVGPSAGYSLSKPFFKKFSQVDCVDPDPLAEIIFKQKFRQKKFRWHNYDYFSFQDQAYCQNGLQHMLGHFEEHAILFCNFLGQVPLLVKKHHDDQAFNEIYSRWTSDLSQCLAHRQWATYHDLMSASGPGLQIDLDYWSSDQAQKDSFHTMAEKSWSATGAVTVMDHLTQDFKLNKTNRIVVPWERVPGEIHIVEAYHH